MGAIETRFLTQLQRVGLHTVRTREGGSEQPGRARARAGRGCIRPSFFCPSKPFSIHGIASERAGGRAVAFLPPWCARSVARSPTFTCPSFAAAAPHITPRGEGEGGEDGGELQNVAVVVVKKEDRMRDGGFPRSRTHESSNHRRSIGRVHEGVKRRIRGNLQQTVIGELRIPPSKMMILRRSGRSGHTHTNSKGEKEGRNEMRRKRGGRKKRIGNFHFPCARRLLDSMTATSPRALCAIRPPARREGNS